MSHNHNHAAQHSSHNRHGLLVRYGREVLALFILVVGIGLRHFGCFDGEWGTPIEVAYFVLALSPIIRPIITEAWEAWRHGDVMNEYTLMLLASVGAFMIGEYPEGVAILLFYSFGEKLEHTASERARSRISSLIGSIPSKVEVVHDDGSLVEMKPQEVKPGFIIKVKPGERLAVDAALMVPEYAEFNTSAITGESVPVAVRAGNEVQSGAIAVDREVTMRTVRSYSDSTMTRIMNMIEDAASGKSRSETLLRKITRYYTPAVVAAAILVMVVPWAISMFGGYLFDWRMWLYRSLVLMVCSCPCALVVSIPLSYFAAIGNASRRGVLFKGSKYLDAMRGVDTVFLDKTGTLTTGSFSITEVVPAHGFDSDEIVEYAAALDSQSTHPLAVAIQKASKSIYQAEDVRTVPHGMKGTVHGKTVLVGSPELMRVNDMAIPELSRESSVVCVAVDGTYAGAIYLDDTLKPDAVAAVEQLHQLGIKRIVILSGDREEAVARAATLVHADGHHSRLLPQNKHELVERSRNEGHRVAFVGDGINDAPSLASADIGIAIGTGGTDVAMESADAVITGHSLTLLGYAVALSRKIKRVVVENVTLAIGVKMVVMVLGTLGMASLWAAVFADTGITLLTVLWTMLALRK